MAIAISVSPGKVFVAGQPFDVDDLNAAANPSVTIDGSAGAPVSGSDIQDNTITMAKLMQGAYFYGAATYSAGLYTINQTPDSGTIADGQMLIFKADAANASGAVNVKLDILSEVDLLDQQGRELVAGDIQADDIVFCVARVVTGPYTSFRVIGTLNTNYPRYATSAGTANAQTLDFSPNIPSYAAMTGKVLVFKVGAALSNTTAATLNIDGLGAADIKRPDGTALVANDLVAGTIAIVVYNGTNFNLLNPASFSISQYYAVSGVICQKVVEQSTGVGYNGDGKQIAAGNTAPTYHGTNAATIDSIAVTPKLSTSSLLVTVCIPGIWIAAAGDVGHITAALYDSNVNGTTALAAASVYLDVANKITGSIVFSHKLSSASTTLRTYYVQIGHETASKTWGWGNTNGSGTTPGVSLGDKVPVTITVEEIA
jgi:hypothetical protein